jgi:hypothetical protein
MRCILHQFFILQGGAHYKQELFFQTKKSHFSADFQGEEGVRIVHYATLIIVLYVIK